MSYHFLQLIQRAEFDMGKGISRYYIRTINTEISITWEIEETSFST